MNTRMLARSLLPLWAAVPGAAAAGTGEVLDAVADAPRVSVEIPLEGPLRVVGQDLLRVNELLEERTEFAAADFQLRELVLVSRSDGKTAGEAELLVMEWRSGGFDIPAADNDEWYEVRIPAPEEHLQGVWLLNLAGDLTVDMLVAVLEPQPAAAAKHATLRKRTVYRVVNDQPKVITRWVHSPAYYRIYHYHHGWPYRYFWGSWSYDLAYRPYDTHYRRHHRARHYERQARRHLRKLRRAHPRMRGTRSAKRRHDHRRHIAPRERTANVRHAETRRSRATAAPRHDRATTRQRNDRGDVERPLPRTRDFTRRAPVPPRPTNRQPVTERHRAPAPVAIERHRAPTPIERHRAPTPIERHHAPAPIERHRAPAPTERHRAPASAERHRAPVPTTARVPRQPAPQADPPHRSDNARPHRPDRDRRPEGLR